MSEQRVSAIADWVVAVALVVLGALWWRDAWWLGATFFTLAGLYAGMGVLDFSRPPARGLRTRSN